MEQQCHGHPPGQICDHVGPSRQACPVCGRRGWRWTDTHGVAECTSCGAWSALLISAADPVKGSTLPQSLLKPEWLPRYIRWWSETEGQETFKEWWAKIDPGAAAEKARCRNALMELKQGSTQTLDDLFKALLPLKGDTFHCDPALTCDRVGDGGWSVHIQPGMAFYGPDRSKKDLPWFKGTHLGRLISELVDWLNENVAFIVMPSGYHPGGTLQLTARITFDDSLINPK